MAAKTVSILGCGWLGLPLAQHLTRQRYKVKGSTTSEDKIRLLEKNGIEPYFINCDPQLSTDNIEDFLDADVLFLNIPYRRDLPNLEFYQKQIEAVLLNVQLADIHFVIFASSTSVYPENNQTATEEDELNPMNPRAKILLDIEDHILGDVQFEGTVIRFAGLYGPNRMPNVSQTVKETAEVPMNLVHLDDCVQIVSEIIESDARGEIFNACADQHPTRRELYTRWAAQQGLPSPQFVDTASSRYKIVSNQKFKRRFTYEYKYPNPLES